MVVKQEKNERVKNYAKNVKDLYMPGKRSSKSQVRREITDPDTIDSTVEERKAFLGSENNETNGYQK